MTPDTTFVETVIRRDRIIVASGLAAIAAIAWWWIVTGVGLGMGAASMSSWSLPPKVVMASVPRPWDFHYWMAMIAMWWVMMIAMMVPSAAPMILLYARVARQGQDRAQIAAGPLPTGAFATGYLAIWLVFSVFACMLQAGAEYAGLLHTMLLWPAERWLAAVVLIAAGAYQLSPLKAACLKHCRSPVQFLTSHWRTGTVGALRMGGDHGLYCLGCCWFLMALLFAGGIMNLVWIAGLAIYVLIEKLAPGGFWVARIGGSVLLAMGAYVLAGP